MIRDIDPSGVDGGSFDPHGMDEKPATITNTEGLSGDEWLRDTAMNVMLATEVDEATRILSSALSRRAANSAGRVEVKALEWDRDTYAGWTEAKTSIGEYRAYADGTLVLDSQQISYVKGRDWRDTEAAAQADFNQRILSALTPAVEAEPVAWRHRWGLEGDWFYSGSRPQVLNGGRENG